MSIEKTKIHDWLFDESVRPGNNLFGENHGRGCGAEIGIKEKFKKSTAPTVEVQRFNADAEKGLSSSQVSARIEQGLYNKTGKKYSKSYRSIFLGNLCKRQQTVQTANKVCIALYWRNIFRLRNLMDRWSDGRTNKWRSFTYTFGLGWE